MPEYRLVNPLILGQFNPVCTAPNDEDAAHQLWNSLSNHISGTVPSFCFTIENMKGGSLSSFNVLENTRHKDKVVDFTLTSVKTNLSSEQQTHFKNKVVEIQNQYAQSGGRHHHEHREHRHKKPEDDSSSSESGDEDDDELLYRRLRLLKNRSLEQPIVYYWYSPMVYKYSSLYMPVFTVPSIPYVEINVSSAFLG